MKSPRDFKLVAELSNAPGETLLTPAEVSALTGFAICTLRLWNRQGKGPPRSVIEKRPRYQLGHVRQWLSGEEACAA